MAAPTTETRMEIHAHQDSTAVQTQEKLLGLAAKNWSKVVKTLEKEE